MRTLGGLALLAVALPHAHADGICVSVASSLYGGGILATAPAPFEAGCTYGFSTNVGSSGGIVTTSPASLPTPASLLTSGTINFSDPTGTASSAAASLGLGTLGAYASGSAGGDASFASAALNDAVTFHISDGAPSAPVGFHVHLDGTETGTGTFGNSYQLSFVGVLGFDMNNLGGDPGNFAVTSDPGWGTFTNESQNGFDYGGNISVTDGETIGLTAALSLYCVSAETCDFSHTAAFAMSLPSDVTFTSQSTVLLTQTGASPVPEPASFALIGSVLVLLGASRKRSILTRYFRN